MRREAGRHMVSGDRPFPWRSPIGQKMSDLGTSRFFWGLYAGYGRRYATAWNSVFRRTRRKRRRVRFFGPKSVCSGPCFTPFRGGCRGSLF